MTPEEKLRQENALLEQQVAEEAAAMPAPEEPQPVARPEGPLTAIGNAIDYVVSGDYVNDALNAVNTAATNVFNAPDIFKSNEELEQQLQARRTEVTEGEDFFAKALYGTSENLEAVAEGAQAGLQLPTTVLANLNNQAAPWSTAPARMKDSAIATTLFELAEILTPTLMFQGVSGVAGSAAGLISGGRAVRAGIEAGAAQDVDQLIAGRTLANKLGELSERLGIMPQDEMYKTLVEGEALQSKAFIATVAFLQSYMLEFGVDSILAKVTSKAKPTPLTEKVAKQLNKTPEEIQAALANTYERSYLSALEPEDGITPNTITPTSVVDEGNQILATPAFMKELQRQIGVGLDGLTSAERTYFTNLDVISEETKLQNIVMEMTKELPDLVLNKLEEARMLKRGGEWWSANKQLFHEDWEQLIEKFSDDFTIPFSKEGLSSKQVIELQQNIGTYMREGAFLDFRVPEAFTVASMIGEEMSVKVSKLATVINNLENIGVDYTAPMEVLMDMIDKSQMILVPLRRSKRVWSLVGKAQQRQSKQAVRALDIGPLDNLTEIIGPQEAGKTFEEFFDITSGKRGTIRELFALAKAGDKDANKAVKMLVTQLSMGDPRSALETLEIGADILKNNFFNGRGDWLQSLMYNVGLLSSVGTQVVSAANTIIRQTSEPAALGIIGAQKGFAGTILNQKELALEGRKEALYALGQLSGGITNIFGSAWNGLKAWKYNQPITGTTRFAKKVETLAQKQIAIDRNYLAYRKTLEDQGATPDKMFFAWAEYTMQTVGNNFLTTQPTRLLMAQDAAATSTAFHGTLAGKAMIMDNGKPFSRNFYDLKKKALGKSGDIFKGIRDPDLLEAAKTVTFQREIPRGAEANIIDNAFAAVEKAADESAIWKFFAPFARISWDFLDQVAMSGVGAIPVVGGKVAGAINPRYAKMLSGEMGPAIQMQAKGSMAAAQMFILFAVWQSVKGNMTGKQSGNMPKDSFVVPVGDATNSGFAALPYGRIQPYASYLSVTSDIVNSYQRGAISRGEYGQALGEIVASIGENSLDQTAFTGLVNLGDLIGQGRTSPGWLSDIADAFSLPFAPAFSRMFGRLGDPFNEVAFIDRGDLVTSFAAGLLRKSGRTSELPNITNVYTGRIEPTTATAGTPEEYWTGVRAALMNEFMWPGRIQEAYKDAPWRKLLDEVGYVMPKDFLRTVRGVPLTLNQQAELSKLMSESLSTELTEFYQSIGYKNMRKDLEKARKEAVPNPIPGVTPAVGRNTTVQGKLKDIKDAVEQIHINAKDRAASLIEDPEFQERIDSIKNSGYSEVSNINNPEWRGMYASAAQNQDTELAKQVKAILDIA